MNSITPQSRSLPLLAALLFLIGLSPLPASAGKKDVSVIIDTDIGDDIDDTWALGMALKTPELDIRLVTGSWGKHIYRAKLIGKMLEVADRTDVPIGIGPPQGKNQNGAQSAWVADYDLKKYPGKVYQDGIQAMIDTIMESDKEITVIAIGPLTNIARALQREPRIANKARFISMMGSISKDYNGTVRRFKEYNASADVKASQKALTAPWPILLTPADSVSAIILNRDDYKDVRKSDDPVAEAIVENYRIWLQPNVKHLADLHSSTLFDTLAIFLAHDDDDVKFETMRIRMTNDGYTVVDPNARQMRVALDWTDLGDFKRHLVRTIAKEERRGLGRLFGLK